MSDNLTSNAGESEYAEAHSSPWEVHNQLGDPEICPDYLDKFHTPPSQKRELQGVSEIISVVPRLRLIHCKQPGGWSYNLGSDDILDELSSPVMTAVARVPKHADKGTQAPDMELQVSDEPKGCSLCSKTIEKATESVSGGRLHLGVKRKRRHSVPICVSTTMKIQRIGWSREMGYNMGRIHRYSGEGRLE